MRAIFETPRLALREMSLDDHDFVARMLADPEVMRFYPQCYSRDGAESWVRRQMDRYARHGHGLWLVLDKVTSQPVGQVGLTLQRVEGVEEPEVGYLIDRPSWRRGYATEAASATRDHAFSVLGKDRVISLIRPENVPSEAIGRKPGMEAGAGMFGHGGFEHLVFSVGRMGQRGG